ncbi:hypothetical protein QT971_02145 [Microcoleus sp. herbarium19]
MLCPYIFARVLMSRKRSPLQLTQYVTIPNKGHLARDKIPL